LIFKQREFAKKKGKGSNKDAQVTTDDESADATPEQVEEPVVVQRKQPDPILHEHIPGKVDFSGATKVQTAAPISKDLFGAWSVGDITVTQSVPDNRPPSQEDTIEGRYAYVLFVSASEQEALYTVYEDFQYLAALYTNSEDFRLFT
jgi:hypothetical protein